VEEVDDALVVEEVDVEVDVLVVEEVDVDDLPEVDVVVDVDVLLVVDDEVAGLKWHESQLQE
jgi:hypothetical protein